MTRRENFLKTLRHEKHERMPACVTIDSFNYPDPMPDGLDVAKVVNFMDIGGMIDLLKYFGMDVLIRLIPDPVKLEYDAGVSIKSETIENGNIISTWETPAGKLRSISEPSVVANTAFLTEYPIKRIEDYEVLKCFWKAQKYIPDPAGIDKCKQILKSIGDDGIAYTSFPSTPIMDITRKWTGIENFIYHMADEPEVIKSVLDMMTENYYVHFESIAKNTPCEVLVIWDDVNSLYISPRMFEEYCLPVLRRYSEIARNYGKVLVFHACGKINAFSDLLLKTNVDALDWLSPSPIGDIDPKILQALWKDRITMM
ncbi:MAG TPA: uroporphyrinogen decarboxylase family protein, partial [Candidatus Wunengus sp. YC61]|uniref:uroporphyrinogen decarboxylase family protein n=1 Tax=Candidatus Wunengus sp. YC61 TaxID=3367698 RepID=UPI00402A20F3